MPSATKEGYLHFAGLDLPGDTAALLIVVLCFMAIVGLQFTK